MCCMSVTDSTDTDTAVDDPEPIPLEATATLDYSTNPDRPVTVEVELPGDVVDDPQAAIEAVTIRATVDDE